MKTLLILSALIGFTLPEKLDRTYLPPPGSKFSGGSPGAIDVPLEFPKETYSYSLQDNNFRRPDITTAIDKVSSNIPEKYEDIISTVSPLHENSYGFPTTSTSYAISHTTPYLPAEGSTIEPDVSINSKYPSNNSNNITTPVNFREKNISFDHARPNTVYSEEEKQMLNYIKNILKNQFPDNTINSQVVNKISDESLYSNSGDLDTIPKNNSYSGDLGISSIKSTPDGIGHSLVNNNYDTYHSPPPSEPISKHKVNLISSTPIPIDNVYSKTPSKYVSTTPISITDTPYSYRPERIQAQDRDAVILNYDNTISPEGYAYSFDTSNGIHADEKGIALNGVQAVGSYSYIGDDGQLYSVNYTADENGFRPYGAHLPTAPPIPDAILKVIEQAAIDKENGIYDDGSYDENKYGYQKYKPTKNMHFLNRYNKNKEDTNSNRSKSNNKLLHNNRLEEQVNKDYDTNEQKEQIVVIENQLRPFLKNTLANESVSELSPNYKSQRFENNGKDYIDMSNNDYNNELQNKILNSMQKLNDLNGIEDGSGKEDKLMNIEFYDETGYHYSKPQNDYNLKAADKLINRFPETTATINIPAISKKKNENVPNRPTFMTPYVSQNNDIFIEHDGDDQSIDIPVNYHEEKNIKISNAIPTLAETNMVPDVTENRNSHSFNNQFKESVNLSPFDDQGNSYDQNENSNKNSYVPYISSTEIGLSDITSTIPTAFSSRFNSIEPSKDNNSRNPSKNSESSFLQNQAPFSNPSLDQEKYRGPITHSNKPDNYGNNINDDISDSGPRFNTPNTYGADKDYIKEHSTAKPYSEDFSGPKQPQKYDPLTGYHY